MSLYKNSIGIDATAIPSPIRAEKVVAQNPRPHFLTFVNPEPNKGIAVLARIAIELNRKSSKIPVLVVESRKEIAAYHAIHDTISKCDNVFL